MDVGIEQVNSYKAASTHQAYGTCSIIISFSVPYCCQEALSELSYYIQFKQDD